MLMTSDFIYSEGGLPEEFSKIVDQDWLVSISRILVPVGLMDATIVAKVDAVLDLPEENRLTEFKKIMAEVVEKARDFEAKKPKETVEIVDF